MTATLSATLLLAAVSACGGDSRPSVPPRDASVARDFGRGPDVVQVPDLAVVDLPDLAPPDLQAPPDLGGADAGPPPEAVAFVSPLPGALVGSRTPIRAEVNAPGTVAEVYFYVWGVFPAEYDAEGTLLNPSREDWVRLSSQTESGEGGLYEIRLQDHAELLASREVVDGPRSFRVAARMALTAGQREPTVHAAVSDFVIDREGPALVLVDYPNPEETVTAVGSLRLRFTARDGAGVAGLEIQVDGETERVLPIARSGEYWVSLDLSGRPEASLVGVYSLDELGNETLLTRALRVIPAPPYRLGHPFDLGADNRIVAFEVGFYDEDEYPDLWVSTSGGLWLLLGAPEGGFQGGFQILAVDGGAARHVFLEDVDEDGLEDIILLAPSAGGLEVRVALREASGNAGVLDDYTLYRGQTIDKADEAVRMVDLDGDGRRDLVVALRDGEDSLAVLRREPVDGLPGPGAGAEEVGEVRFFGPPDLLRGTAGVTDIEVADFDGDGALDILVGRTGARQVSCYLRAADGSFYDAIDTFVAGPNGAPVTVHAADFLGNDGVLDLVVGTEGEDELHMLRGLGDGTFRKERRDLVGATPRELVPSYFEHQGEDTRRNHLLVLVPETSTVRFYLPQNDGFEFENAYSTGAAPRNLRAEDMNADGFLDLVYFNEGSGRIMVALGQAVDCDLPKEVLVHLPAEENGDGIGLPLQPIDLAAGVIIGLPGTPSTDDLLVMASPTEARGATIYAPRTEPEGELVALENPRLTPLVVFRSGVSGPSNKRPKVSWVPPPFDAEAVGMALGQLDTLGLDLVVATSAQPGRSVEIVVDPEAEEPVTELVLVPTIAVLRGQNNGQFEPYVRADADGMWIREYYPRVGFTPLPFGAPETVEAAMDGQVVTGVMGASLDSRAGMDLLLFSAHRNDPYREPAVSVWTSLVVSNLVVFDGPVGPWVELGWEPSHWALADMNHEADGLDELIVTSSADQNVAILPRSAQAPPFRSSRFFSTPPAPRGVAGHDLDGDGVAELIVVVEDNVVIGWGAEPHETLPRSFQRMAFLRPGGGYPGDDPQSVLVDDINFDGIPDLIVSNRGSDTISLFFGAGDRSFPTGMEAPTGKGPSKLIRARFNDDNCVDYAVLNPSGRTVTIFLSVPERCP